MVNTDPRDSQSGLGMVNSPHCQGTPDRSHHPPFLLSAHTRPTFQPPESRSRSISSGSTTRLQILDSDPLGGHRILFHASAVSSCLNLSKFVGTFTSHGSPYFFGSSASLPELS